MKELLKKLYKPLLLVLVIGAVTAYIHKHLEEISRFNYEFSAPVLAACLATIVFSYLVLFFIWTRLTESFGLQTPHVHSGKAWFMSHMGKYVPGKVTMLLIRLEAYKGCPRSTLSVIMFVEYFAILASNCSLISIAFLAPSQAIPGIIRVIAALGIVFFLCLLSPPVLKKVINFGFGILKIEAPDNFPAFTLILRYVGSYFVAGMLQGLAFYLALRSLYPLNFSIYLTLTGIYFSATLVGLMAVFTPSGLGVKEGILFLVLASTIPEPVVIIGALLLRLFYITTEFGLACVFWVLEKWLLKGKGIDPGKAPVDPQV